MVRIHRYPCRTVRFLDSGQCLYHHISSRALDPSRPEGVRDPFPNHQVLYHAGHDRGNHLARVVHGHDRHALGKVGLRAHYLVGHEAQLA